MELELSDIGALLKEGAVRASSYTPKKYPSESIPSILNVGGGEIRRERPEVLERVFALQESMANFKSEFCSREFLIIEVVDTADEVSLMLRKLSAAEFSQPEIDSKASLYKRIQELQRVNSELSAKLRIDAPLSRNIPKLERYISLSAGQEKSLTDTPNTSLILQETIRVKDTEKEQLSEHIQILTKSLERIRQGHEERLKDLKARYRDKLDNYLNKLSCASSCVNNFLLALEKVEGSPYREEQENFEVEKAKLVELSRAMEEFDEVPRIKRLTALNVSRNSETTAGELRPRIEVASLAREATPQQMDDQRPLTSRPASRSVIVKDFNDIIYNKQNSELYLKKRITDLEELVEDKVNEIHDLKRNSVNALKSQMMSLIKGSERKFLAFLDDLNSKVSAKEGKLKDLAGALIRLARRAHRKAEETAVQPVAVQPLEIPQSLHRRCQDVESENKALKKKLVEFEELMSENVRVSSSRITSKDLLLKRSQQVIGELTENLRRSGSQLRVLQKAAVETHAVVYKKDSLDTALGDSDLTLKEALLTVSECATKKADELWQTMLEAFKDRLSPLIRSIQLLRQNVVAQKDEVDYLIQEKQVLVNEEKQMKFESEKRINEKEEIIKQLQSEIKVLADEKETIKELNEVMSSKDKKIEELNNAIKQVKDEQDKQLKEIADQLESEKQQLELKDELVEELKTEHAKLMMEEKEKNEIIQNLNKNNNNLATQLSNAKEQLDSLTKQNADSESKCSELVKEMEEKAKEVSNLIEALSTKDEELANGLERQKQMEEHYGKRLKELEAALAELRDELGKKEEIARNWELMNEKLKIELEMERCRSGFVDIERGRLEQTGADVNLDSIENLENRIKELQSELNKRDKENSETMKGLVEKSENLQELNKKLNSELEGQKSTAEFFLNPKASMQAGTDAQSISIDEVLRHTENIRQMIIHCAEVVPLNTLESFDKAFKPLSAAIEMSNREMKILTEKRKAAK
eukprot:TRINITY_DN9940_c0_g3_i1.p1 TRINITY_DN9940_c0_g3~~TRINITY_DN9940_c0_g3_i1.p1  ORF type:complete len:986 (+),score=324.99 TRINITY_DN9940_c0_g3_i1:483-3440(+)